MPTILYLKGGGKLVIKGDSMETSVLKKGFGRKAAGIAMNGHEVLFKISDVLLYEFQPEAEAKAEAEAQEKAKAEAAGASHCRRCGANSPKEFSYCPKCGSALVKKEGPRLEVPGMRT